MNRTILCSFSKLLIIAAWSTLWGGACASPSYTIPTSSSTAAAATAGSAGTTSSRATGYGAALNSSAPQAGVGGGAGNNASTAGTGGSDPITFPVSCDGDADCNALRATRVCDIVSQTCVECLPGKTACGAGQYCGVDKECHIGCSSNADCLKGSCDVAQNRCVGCETAADCAAGTRCDVTTGTCVPSCENSSHCPSGWVCCTGVCANLELDDANCGSCGTSCARTNAKVGCSETGCHLLECKAGYADCNGRISDGCEIEVSSNASNCGTCGTTCASHQVCKSSTCVTADCTAGYRNCDNRDENGCETNVLRDVLNCGACSSPCSTANGTPSCDAGLCQMTCTSGWGDCDGNPLNGCEAEHATSTKHCGRCDTSCTNVHGETACVANRCTPSCQTGYGDCDGVVSNGCETDVLADANHCSACNKPCNLPNATASCSAGQCAIASCAAGFEDCNGRAEDGCEVNLLADVANCGQCRMACSSANGTASCNQGQCAIACAADFGNCSTGNNGCETDLTTNLSHCGKCNAGCTAPANTTAACYAKTCSYTCASGFDNCNNEASDGCEANIQTDPLHCGQCNRQCPAGCTGGVCDTPCTGKTCPDKRIVTVPTTGNYLNAFGTSSVCFEAVNLPIPIRGGRTDSFTDGTIRINGTVVAPNVNWPETSFPAPVAGGHCIEVSGGTGGSRPSRVEIWFQR